MLPCHFGCLSYCSHFYLLRHVHSQWLGGSWLGMSILFYYLHFSFCRRECPCSRRWPTVPKSLSIIIIIIVCGENYHVRKILIFWSLCIISHTRKNLQWCRGRERNFHGHWFLVLQKSILMLRFWSYSFIL